MPAEWEPHDATWFSWPHNTDTWPTGLAETEANLSVAVRALAAGETVYINVLDASHRDHVSAIVGDVARVEYLILPTNDAWCRDHGATFVLDGSERIAVNWHYNAWGGKYPPFDLDQKVARLMARHVGARVEDVAITFEGGGIESNGQGVILTTESCILNPNRNPGLSRAEVEELFLHYLGARTVVWLAGELVGDDTDGHIDNLVRFASTNTILFPQAPDDPDHGPGFEMNRRIMESTLGEAFRLIPMPHPDPVWHEGVRLPAGYMNFYVGNAAVVVPVYDCASDDTACSVLAACYPDRTIVPVRCNEIIRGLGALHCLSQQVPSIQANRHV